MDAVDLARLRLRTSGPLAPTAASPADAVRRLLAVQSQELREAKWSLGQRSGTSVNDVDVALAAGDVVRTHVLRPTWHWVARDDLRWLLELTGPRVMTSVGSQLRSLGLGADVRQRACRVAEEALRGGRTATRTQLHEAFVDAGIACDRAQLAQLLLVAELEAVVCSGPEGPGGVQTYALVDDRCPPAIARERDELVDELVVRYFTSHGPATLKDCGWWSSLTQQDIRRAVERQRDRLDCFTFDGLTLWHARDADLSPGRASGVHLLQTFDEWVVAYRDSRWVVDRAGIANMIGREWGAQGHPVVSEGQVIAHWKCRYSPESVVVSVRPCRPLTTGERRGVAATVEEFAAFWGRSGQMVVDTRV